MADDPGRPLESLPSVAVVVVNFNGSAMLDECLTSVAQQSYPPHLLRTVVVDNGSDDGSLEMLARRHPWAEVVALQENVGFAPAINVGVRSAGADCVVLLNNDCWAAPDLVERLTAAWSPADGVVCVGARLLDWTGDRVDFVGGAVNFHGMAHQPGHGEPVNLHASDEIREVLFACGGAMLVDRGIYLNTGGFDDDFFAYFEDVDFGWRLWLAGYRVVLSPAATVRHRLHGTASRFPEHQRLFLYERNALMMVLKNYGDDLLHRVMGPALLLTVQRAVIRGGLDRAPYRIGGDDAADEPAQRLVLAHLHAVADVVDNLDAVLVRRRAVQASRQRADAELLPLFKELFWPVIADEAYEAALSRVVDGFGLRGLADG